MSKNLQYRPEIDGLRALAVLPVIFFHAGFDLFSGGYVGVDVFFVISGYLITSIIIREYHAGRFSFADFYERRARRILPALFLVMLTSLIGAYFILMPGEFKDYAQSLFAVSLFSSNFLFWTESGYFDTLAELKPLLHTWSLAVEEQYYILFPPVLFLLWSHNKKYRTLLVLTVLGILSLALAQAGLVYGHTKASFFLFPSRAWELFAGSLCAICLYYQEIDKKDILLKRQKICELLAFIGLSLIIIPVFLYDENTPFPGLTALLPVFGTVLIILFATGHRYTQKILSHNIFVFIGLISYSAYLWHQPLFAYVRYYMQGTPSDLVFIGLTILSLFLAYLSWKFIEAPFRKKTFLSRRQIFLFSVMGLLLFAGLGIAGHISNGFPQRFSPESRTMLQQLDELDKQRNKIIKEGGCHFGKRKKFTSVNQFQDTWNCLPTSEELTLPQALPIIIIGDSHAADSAAALRENGYIFGQMTGAGCSLTPHLMRKYCKEQFAFLKDVLSERQDIKTIVMFNRFSDDELKISALKDAIEFWKGYDKELVFVTALPEIHMLQYRTIRAIEAGRSYNFVPEMKVAEKTETVAILNLMQANNVEVINGRQLFCSLTPDCSLQDENGTALLIDYQSHLTPHGLKLFGKKLGKELSSKH